MNLLIHQAALGDWVLTFPILGALAPEPTLAVTSGSKARLAARLMPHVQPIDIEHPGWSALFAPIDWASESSHLYVGPMVNQIFAPARRIISFVSDGEDDWAGNVRQLAPHAQLFFVVPRPPEDWPGHVGDWHAHQLRAQGLDLGEFAMSATMTPSDQHEGPIVIHPGSGGQDKCWPLERYETLIHTLRANKLIVLPILGEVEADRWPAAALQHWTGELGARILTSLDGLADVLQEARLFVGNDSGPTHLAAQMGVTTLALMGPTSPTRWGPRGLRVRALAPTKQCGMDWLDVDRVNEACMEIVR